MRVERTRFLLSGVGIVAAAVSVAVAGIVGGPYFLYLMRKQQQLGEL